MIDPNPLSANKYLSELYGDGQARSRQGALGQARESLRKGLRGTRDLAAIVGTRDVNSAISTVAWATIGPTHAATGRVYRERKVT